MVHRGSLLLVQVIHRYYIVLELAKVRLAKHDFKVNETEKDPVSVQYAPQSGV